MVPIYPLTFHEIFKEKIWGGDRLREVCGKDFAPGSKIGESWEISDYADELSRVRNGPLKGKTLHEIIRDAPDDILGRKIHRVTGMAFPLLLKFIHAADILSVQVHPDDSYAACHHPGQFGKTEAWFILDAEPGAEMIFGLKEGCTREEFRRLLAAGRLEECLNAVPVKRGDALFCAPGTVHAIGAGIVLTEIQQTSDLTYRVYDWNRLGSDGKPRELHIEHALNVIDFGSPPPSPVKPRVLTDGPVRREELINCEKFVFEHLALHTSSFQLGGSGVFEIISVIGGSGRLQVSEEEVHLRLGESLLLPAAVGVAELSTDTSLEVLRSWVP